MLSHEVSQCHSQQFQVFAGIVSCLELATVQNLVQLGCFRVILCIKGFCQDYIVPNVVNHVRLDALFCQS